MFQISDDLLENSDGCFIILRTDPCDCLSPYFLLFGERSLMQRLSLAGESALPCAARIFELDEPTLVQLLKDGNDFLLSPEGLQQFDQLLSAGRTRFLQSVEYLPLTAVEAVNPLNFVDTLRNELVGPFQPVTDRQPWSARFVHPEAPP